MLFAAWPIQTPIAAGWEPGLRERYADHCLRIPMRAEARSLNLSNTAAILCYEALRQQNMLGQIDLNV